MRIVLLYPPPWKIPADGEPPDGDDGPPKDGAGINLAGDFSTTPQGLLSLAAQARRAGHQVKAFNLSLFPWREVESLLAGLDADVFGLTCFTSNRRGVALTAACIRKHHPRAHIVAGGPHVTALPAEMLRWCPAIDTVVIGEGEATFDELLSRLAAGQCVEGVAGTAWRDDGSVRVEPKRPRIAELDSLAPVHEHFGGYILLTSRGCPNRCTFCASESMWQRKLRFHSVDYVLDSLEELLRRLPVKMVAVKDDTFTASRQRARRICEGILDRKLNFLWSCDTRADALDEPLLRAMRLAGCQRVSLGVESGSPKILKNIGKGISPEQVLAATGMARKVGLRVRYYMMAGNRGETWGTFQESLRLIEAGRPDEFVFCVLSIYPGTTEFEILRRRDRFLLARPGRSGPELTRWRGGLGPRTFSEQRWVQLWAFPDTPPADAQRIAQWLQKHEGIRKFRQAGVSACQGVLERLGDLHAAHLDLGAAYAFANRPDEAEKHVRRALELDYPVPSLAENYLACIAAQTGDLSAAKDHLAAALARPAPHPLIAQNMAALTGWLDEGGPKSGRPLELTMRHDFEIIPEDRQPTRPGPLPEDCCDWPARATAGGARPAAACPA